MPRFHEFDLAVVELERGVRAGIEILDRLDEGIDQASISRVCQVADRLHRLANDAAWPKRPVDMTAEEWNFSAIRNVRARIETLRQTAGTVPRDVGDWARELRLAISEFQLAFTIFLRDVER